MTAPKYDTRETRLKLLRISYQHAMAQGKKSGDADPESGKFLCRYRAADGSRCAAAPFILGYELRMESKSFVAVAYLYPKSVLPAALANSIFVGSLQLAHDSASGENFTQSYQENLAQILAAGSDGFTLEDAASHSINVLLHAVALYIEERPEMYDFKAIHIPLEGETGCMLGLLAGMAGLPSWDEAGNSANVLGVGNKLLGVHNLVFYERVSDLCGGRELATVSAADTAKALRQYADTYHPEPF